MERQSSKISIDDSHVIDNKTGDLLNCMICTNILWKPVACETCENHFCEGCINTWLSKNKENLCPNHCNFKLRKPQPILVSLLSQLKIKCLNDEFGCDRVLNYEEFDNHFSICLDFLDRICEGCNSKIRGKEFERHIEFCDLIKITCEECHESFARKDAGDHNQITCLQSKVKLLENEVCLLKEESSNGKQKLEAVVRFLSGKFGFELSEDVNSSKISENSSFSRGGKHQHRGSYRGRGDKHHYKQDRPYQKKFDESDERLKTEPRNQYEKKENYEQRSFEEKVPYQKKFDESEERFYKGQKREHRNQYEKRENNEQGAVQEKIEGDAYFQKFEKNSEKQHRNKDRPKKEREEGEKPPRRKGDH